MPGRKQLFTAAEGLHAHLVRRHYSKGLLRGPDAGVRFNLRAWRFVKSCLSFIPWNDGYVFMQTQGHWILANWLLHSATGERRYRELAIESTDATLNLQKPEGFWTYPLPERRKLVATVEGDWGAVGLLATYTREPRAAYLQAAIRWYDLLVSRIGFQDHTPGKAVNYFDKPRGKVPNNSVEAAWLFLLLWKSTGDERFLQYVGPMLDFVVSVQVPNGELPYVVKSQHEQGREHYLCFQYNAFQFLKLVWADSIKPGTRAHSALPKLGQFLAKGVTPSGACATDCENPLPEVDYYTAVLGAALYEVASRGWVESFELSDRCYERLLARQRRDGSFGYSGGDYGFLRDGRSYPRPQAMTLFHLLSPYWGSGFPGV